MLLFLLFCVYISAEETAYGVCVCVVCVFQLFQACDTFTASQHDHCWWLRTTTDRVVLVVLAGGLIYGCDFQQLPNISTQHLSASPQTSVFLQYKKEHIVTRSAQFTQVSGPQATFRSLSSESTGRFWGYNPLFWKRLPPLLLVVNAGWWKNTPGKSMSTPLSSGANSWHFLSGLWGE